MDQRWEALFGVATVAILFLPLFFAVIRANRSSVPRATVLREQRAAHEREIAEYRKSPLSRLLILND